MPQDTSFDLSQLRNSSYFVCHPIPFDYEASELKIGIVAGPFDNKEEAKERKSREGDATFIARVNPLPDFPVFERPKLKKIKAMIKKGKAPFVAVSWTPSNDGQFQVHTRRQLTLTDVDKEARLLTKYEEDPSRIHFTMKLIKSREVDLYEASPMDIGI